MSRGEVKLQWIDSQYRILQELAGTITSTIASLEPTSVLTRQIENSARANLVALNAVRVNRDLIGTPARSLIVGQRGTITATTISEGNAITKVNPTFTPSTITPEKYGVGVEITYEAMDAFQFDLINSWLDEAGYAMGKAIDTAVVTALMLPAAGKGTVTATTS